MRPGLERGTSVDQPRGGPSSSPLRQPVWLSQAVPTDLWMESAGWQAPTSGSGWKGIGCRRGHRTGDPRTLGTGKEASTPCLRGNCRGYMVASSGLSPQGQAGRALHPGPGFQLDGRGGQVAGPWATLSLGLTGPLRFSVPGTRSTGGREQPAAERLWDRGLSWLPRGRAWPSWYRGSSTPGASRTIQAHLEEVLSRDPGLGGPSLGTERWGYAWVPAPSPTPALSLHPPGSITFPGATLPPTPTLPPRLRGFCRSTAEESLVTPGVGRQGRPGCVDEGLGSTRGSGTVSRVHLSPDCLPCDLPPPPLQGKPVPHTPYPGPLSPPRCPRALRSPPPPQPVLPGFLEDRGQIQPHHFLCV